MQPKSATKHVLSTSTTTQPHFTATFPTGKRISFYSSYHFCYPSFYTSHPPATHQDRETPHSDSTQYTGNFPSHYFLSLSQSIHPIRDPRHWKAWFLICEVLVRLCVCGTCFLGLVFLCFLGKRSWFWVGGGSRRWNLGWRSCIWRLAFPCQSWNTHPNHPTVQYPDT